MKIAIFTDTYVPDVNGVAKTLQRFTNYLSDQGHEYQVFAPKSTKESKFTSQVHHLTSLPFFMYPDCRFSIPNLFQVKAEILRFQPDLIHIATPFNVGLCGLRYAKKYNIPIVGSYHTDFDKYLSYYNLDILSKPLWKYFHWFHRPMQKIFVPSADTLYTLKQMGFTNLEIWGRGVDTTLFQPTMDNYLIRKKYNIKEKYILNYVGRISPEKNVELLLEINAVLPKHLSDQIRWIIVGDGPSKPELMKQAPANMTFTGYLHGKDLADVYAASDLFVFPSATETFGNVVLEAMASGTPAISANSGGVVTIIKHGKNGFLCDPKHPEQFAITIENTIKNSEILATMSSQARAYAITQTWESTFDKLIAAYDRVLEKEENVVKNA
ncbi:glycosyltransferase family 4 protein [Aquibacillus albus]|uniref:Glycosyltransferase involved in cell wall biosynthesis n=1 Tax=Aquibacillus albus TaxID=1168171 RepID=A0ABS2N619_9BACI|nr:glycosyltransferase family 1 protein [Aquibacillus albus]MBM7573488.1 glycosyltransferase involved in cell wall biosynthesis [Aquibacillus albus]